MCQKRAGFEDLFTTVIFLSHFRSVPEQTGLLLEEQGAQLLRVQGPCTHLLLEHSHDTLSPVGLCTLPLCPPGGCARGVMSLILHEEQL